MMSSLSDILGGANLGAEKLEDESLDAFFVAKYMFSAKLFFRRENVFSFLLN